MTKWISHKHLLLLVGSGIFTMTSTISLAEPRRFSIDCEHTIYPSCCTAIHQSAGANAEYYWTASKGSLEAENTNFQWNWHHCNEATGKVDLNTSIDKGAAYGHGRAYCPSQESF